MLGRAALRDMPDGLKPNQGAVGEGRFQICPYMLRVTTSSELWTTRTGTPTSGGSLELAALTLPAVLDCREDHWHHPTQEDDGRPSGTRTILVLPPTWSLHPAAPALESRAPRGIATACRRARSRRQNRHFGSGTRRTERRHGRHRHVPKTQGPLIPGESRNQRSSGVS